MSTKLLKLGIIGLGNAAALMIPSLAAHPAFALAAAADPRPEARAKFEADFGCPTFSRTEDMFASGLVDAVYIASPHQYHVANAQAAASWGKHVLVEKPMALTLSDGAAMIDAAERNGTVLVVGHSQAFSPSVLAMQDIIGSGEIGAVRMITSIVYTNFLYRPRRPEELDTASGGGIIFNQLPHQMDIVRALAGAGLTRISAATGAWDKHRPTEGALTAFLEFEEGVAASLVYSGYDHFDTDELHGWVDESGAEKPPSVPGATRAALASLAGGTSETLARGRAGYAGRGVRKTDSDSVHQPHFGFLLVTCENGDMRASPDGLVIYGDNGRRDVRLPPGRAFPNRDAVVDEFFAAIVGETPAVHDGSWGMATMSACLAVLQSSRERREVRFDPPLTSNSVRSRL